MLKLTLFSFQEDETQFPPVMAPLALQDRQDVGTSLNLQSPAAI